MWRALCPRATSLAFSPFVLEAYTFIGAVDYPAEPAMMKTPGG